MKHSWASASTIIKAIKILRESTTSMALPTSDAMEQEYGVKDPYQILISCLLSLRTRDKVSIPVSIELFKYARTPEQMVKLPLEEIAQIIKKVNLYYGKAKNILKISKTLIEKYNGKVPADKDILLSLPGVGPKTANLVLGCAFDIPAICVDTHVHRISNRLGWVTSKKPEQTEEQLQKVVPIKYWIEINRLLVMWGQNICTPVNPKCSICPLSPLCPKIGVISHR
ncbi:endonuclease III [Vermiphilus pyriformis]|nr:MAG: endonuclease III [Vermiphilus pyriformis]